MEKDLKLSKAEDEPEVKATQYQKVVGSLRYLLHTRPDLTYSVGVVSRYMQSPRESHARAIKQILRYLKALLDMFSSLGHCPFHGAHGCVSSNLAQGVIGGSDRIGKTKSYNTR
ncbi:uncharacterized mitochondrial protein-like protein [Tanacetum coccineum]